MPTARLVIAALALTACANNSYPKHTSIETTFPARPAAQIARSLRVVTFNVHMEPGHKIARAFQADPALRAADVIFMQEVERDERSPTTMCSGACAVGKELGYHVVYAPGHGVKNGSHGVAVLSRAPITSAEVIELPYFNVHINSGRRVALAATLDVDGSPVTVYAVHLDNRLDVRDRRIQMIPVLIHAARQDTPVIMGGDFNTSHFTWLWHVVPILTTTQDNYLEELMHSHGFDTPVTNSGPTHVLLGMRLDAIYTRGFRTTKFAVSNASYVSDHLALWAQMELPARPVTTASM